MSSSGRSSRVGSVSMDNSGGGSLAAAATVSWEQNLKTLLKELSEKQAIYCAVRATAVPRHRSRQWSPGGELEDGDRRHEITSGEWGGGDDVMDLTRPGVHIGPGAVATSPTPFQVRRWVGL